MRHLAVRLIGVCLLLAAAASALDAAAASAVQLQPEAVVPRSATVGAGGGTVGITVYAAQPWSVTSDQAWLTFTPSSSTGNDTVTLTIAPHTSGRWREARVTIGGVVVAISQSGVPSTLTVDPTSWSAGAAGGTRPVNVASTVDDTGWGATVMGTVSTRAGGANGYRDGTGSAAQFASPRGLAVDGAGNVYVADTNNHRIRKVTPGGVVTTVAGGASGYADGPVSLAQFYSPEGIAVGADGTLYVADAYNHRIRTISPDGMVATLAGAGSPGWDDGIGAAAKFYFPSGVAVDTAGIVYVSDWQNHSIRKITAGGQVTTFVGGSSGYVDDVGRNARMHGPTSIAIDAGGALYVTESSRVRKITAAGVVTTMAGGGSTGFADGLGKAATFSYPSGVAADTHGNVFVADRFNNRVRRVTPDGAVTTLAGSAASGATDGVGAAARFYDPMGIAVDAAGVVYVGQLQGGVIRVIRPQDWLTASVAAGAGSQAIGVTALANTGPSVRTGMVSVAGGTVTVTQAANTITASPSALRFTAVREGSAGVVTGVTPAQTVTVGFGAGTPAWTVSASHPWLSLSRTGGAGAGTFDVAVVNPGQVLDGVSNTTATITVTAPDAAAAPVIVTVQLAVRSRAELDAPVGAFDTPVTGTTVQGSIAVTGWALDDVGIDRVEIWRDRITNDPVPPFRENGHPADGKVFIANGTFVAGTRPDVEAIFTTTVLRHRAGWGYLLLTWGFPNANGTFVLTAIAWDVEGRSTVLGTKTITVNNAAANRPFGSIDVPAYGAAFSGHNFTYGWALTPNAGCTIAGGQKFMTVDSVPATGAVSHGVDYGSYRTDIAAAFPGFTDSNGAGGAAAFNSTLYANGTYQIGWLVYDSCNNGEGIGSRFFQILNAGGATRPAARYVIEGTGPAFARVGRAAADVMPAAAAPLWLVRGIGTTETRLDAGATVWLSQTGRVEVHATRPHEAPEPGVRYEGYLIVDDTLRPLPLGTTFDAARGSFYWQPVAGFLGTYTLRIVQVRDDAPADGWTVPIEIGPVADTALLHIDRADGPGSPSAVLEGWALDPQAIDGSGIGLVHVWATPAGGGTPFFVGEATLGRHRADVGARYGRQFDFAGYSVPLAHLPAGAHHLVVYAWSLRTGRWEAARVIAVTVR